MRGKLMFIGGLAAGFVLGARAGREKYEEIAANARKVWENPTVQEAAGAAQAQANRLVAEGKDKLSQSKIGEKLNSSKSSSSTSTSTDSLEPSPLEPSPLEPSDTSMAGSTTATVITPSSTGTTY